MKVFYAILFFLIFGIGSVHAQADATLQDRLQSNIFLKVEASATDVFVGEPITVTYKLYSALESESNVVSRPSFVGFDMKDLMTSSSQIPARENIDGVVFDVHTILKVELTPYKAGTLSLSALTMRNRVRLADANGNKSPILKGISEDVVLNNGYYTFQLSSVPIAVISTALPQSTRPSANSGVVGLFKMTVETSKKLYAPGESGSLVITIMGVGNFDKIPQPKIKWPKGVEVFPSKIDESASSGKGSDGYKSFTIPFKVQQPGRYTIPSVDFSFFDISTNKYKTITNIPVEFDVVAEGEAVPIGAVDAGNESLSQGDLIRYAWPLGIAVLLVLILLFWMIFRKKKDKPLVPQHTAVGRQSVQKKEPSAKPAKMLSVVDIDSLLQPAAEHLHQKGNAFFLHLKQGIVQFSELKFGIQPELFNHETLKKYCSDHQVEVHKQVDLLSLLSEIDMSIYSGGAVDANEEMLLNRTKALLQNF